MTHGWESASRRLVMGPTTRGITSPAFSTRTQSPARISLRAMSSALCSVAIDTIDPAMNTGSSIANGVTAPVRPTFTSMLLSSVVFCSAGNLNAIAHRGNLLVVPSRVRLLPRGDLERNRPWGEFAGRAGPRAQVDAIELDDDAVGVEVERAALLLPLRAEGHERLDTVTPAPMRLDGQPPCLQRVER